MKNFKIPNLLCPAGSPEALLAAISAGADEIYFGAREHNARYCAKNFSDEEFEKAIKLCRIHGRASNITVNTLVSDREINGALDLVYNAASLGADAFIVQDLGLASLIHKSMPEVILHASTQCACHNLDGAKRLCEAGFSRIVLARELSLEDIEKISSYGGFETEVFVHGALCVSHSGQCLFSSCVGGRSGNRGMCAQPCRMEYSLDGKSGYPLSLRDLSYARHIKELISSGVTSLKIEGRMKSPEYVYGVASVYKTLLTEGRDASNAELSELEEIFSRSGTTDGCLTKKYLKSNRDMYGIRSESDKEKSKAFEKSLVIPAPKREIGAVGSFVEGQIPSLSLICKDVCVTAQGDAPLDFAKNQSASAESLTKNLIKTGETPFSLSPDDISLTVGNSVFVPVSAVNELRRKALCLLEDALCKYVPVKRARISFVPQKNAPSEKVPSVRLYLKNTDNFEQKLLQYKAVDRVLFPLSFFTTKREIPKVVPFGVLFPRVLFETEAEKAGEYLSNAKASGAVFCEVSNIGHIDIARNAGLEVYGGIGLNVYNTPCAEYLASLCISSLVLSTELKLGAVRDIVKNDNVNYAFYAKGRVPLMVTESCAICAHTSCKKNKDEVCGKLVDRIGAVFPVYSQGRLDKEFPCRNIIYNSVSLNLLAKKELYTSGIDTLCISGEDDGMPM